MFASGASILNMFVPKEFAPLLKCISPHAFKVVDWQSVVAQSPQLTRRVLQRLGVEDLKTSLEKNLPKQLSFDISSPNSIAAGGEGLGQVLLELYFRQIYNPAGIFLDLRPGTFFQKSEGAYIWTPNGLWIKWDESFRQGLLQIYEGYYGDNPDRLRAGLAQVGLTRADFSSEKIKEVETMLLSHIGGDTTSQKFEVSNFTRSFEQLFQFLLKNEIRLSGDFLYLGVYLAGLYLHLQKLGGAYDVRRAFSETRNSS